MKQASMDFWSVFNRVGSVRDVNILPQCLRYEQNAARRPRRQTSKKSQPKLRPSKSPCPYNIHGRYTSTLGFLNISQDLKHDEDSYEPSKLDSNHPHKKRQGVLKRRRSHQLATSRHFTTLVTYASLSLLFIPTSAAPCSSLTYLHLSIRQSIPDQLGNTGNDPAPTTPREPPSPLEPTTITPPLTLPPTSTQSGTTQTANPVPPGENSSLPEIQHTHTPIHLSTVALAGVIVGGVITLIALVFLIIVYFRHVRRSKVVKMPVYYSKPGSRLGGRVVNPSPALYDNPGSLNGSAVVIDRSELQEKMTMWRGGGGGTFMRNKEMVKVLRRAFIKEEKQHAKDGRGKVKRISKTSISGPRPARPASAEPLGRLNGMGMGMGMGSI